MGRMKSLWLLLGVLLFTVSTFTDVSADVIPSENECRPYIEKAIHELKNTETTATDNKESTEDVSTNEQDISLENATENSVEQTDGDVKSQEDNTDSTQDEQTSAEKTEDNDSKEETTNDEKSQEQQESQEVNENQSVEEPAAEGNQSVEEPTVDESSKEETGEVDSKEVTEDSSVEVPTDGDDTQEQNSAQVDGDSEQTAENASNEPEQNQNESNEEENTATEETDSSKEEEKLDEKSAENNTEDGQESQEGDATEEKEESVEEEKVRTKRSISEEATQEQDSAQDGNESLENADDTNKSEENVEDSNKSEENANESQEANATAEDETQSQEANEEPSTENENSSNEANENASEGTDEPSKENVDDSKETASVEANDEQSNEGVSSTEANEASQENDNQQEESKEEVVEESAEDEAKSEETMPEEELTLEFEIPKNLRSRDHISALLGLDAESSIKENSLKRTGDVILKELKKIYDNAVKPLETMYKYRDLSNRHFGDPEIFSKPLILFMGPWSGGKSTILNYLTANEYTPNSIRSGAEPSPAHFNILMHGEEPEVLDGTQLAADWTFSGLQKFGQGLMDRLRGQRLPNKLLERVNIVEIPGILEVRKQVSRYFPFNDACQWFIDRADIIFLVYDPSKLDVGPETEAILDQLKGREYQTRILLNKADQVKPEELLRVQGALIWNISPLMSSAQPPVMYTVSLWSHPYEAGSPIRLLQAQERALLVDLREAIDKRIENKIASARRFAVRIRNHAKMVDCYLTTYYNQKGLFSNKKQTSDKIIEHPQNYNIYEGLSTLTNISRYDLPDPEVYLDFFRLNPLYEFKKLSETCTYFKGCPINKLDIAIAYDLPELVGKYKNILIENLVQLRKEYEENCNQTEPEPPVKINQR